MSENEAIEAIEAIEAKEANKKSKKLDRDSVRKPKKVTLAFSEKINGKLRDTLTLYRPTMGDLADADLSLDSEKPSMEQMLKLVSLLTKTDIEDVRKFDPINFTKIANEVGDFLEVGGL